MAGVLLIVGCALIPVCTGRFIVQIDRVQKNQRCASLETVLISSAAVSGRKPRDRAGAVDKDSWRFGLATSSARLSFILLHLRRCNQLIVEYDGLEFVNRMRR